MRLGIFIFFISIVAILNGQERKPNIVFILADDLGFECLSVNGAAEYKTPNLDKLAKDGINFKHCYAQPLCTPTRVTLMTGLYNKRNYEGFGYLPSTAVTFANTLKDAGYATCIVGKWQLLGGFKGPNKFGFDEYCLWQLTRTTNVKNYPEAQKDPDNKPERTSRYPNPGLEINGKEVDFTNGEYAPDILNNYACDFIKRHKEKPFLLYYPMILTHCPFEPTPDSADWDPKSKGSQTYVGDPKYFPDMVNYMDKMVGNVVRTLDENGLSDNTLIIFLGDNGTDKPIVTKMKDGTTIKGGKGTLKNTGTHVPFIAKWPGKISKESLSNDMVDLTDFYPTLCDVAKIAVPSKLDGHSLIEVFQGKKHTRQWSYCWWSSNRKKSDPEEFVRNQQFKLYRDGHFFDVGNDSLEKQAMPINSLQGEALEAYKMLKNALDATNDIRPEHLKK